MSTSAEKNLLTLADAHLHKKLLDISLLKGDGSDRQIYLIHPQDDPNQKVIGVYHEDVQENLDFIHITQRMKEVSLPVPEIFAVDPSNQFYLLQYLGEKNLGQWIDLWLKEGNQQKIIQAYLKVLPHLITIQQTLTSLLSKFLEKKLMKRKDFADDLAYFEGNFVKRFGFEELFHNKVRNELDEYLLNPIGQLKPSVFVYRDFQSRNIMWLHEQPWFIDYQSAFLGTRFYDLASLLYASKSGLDDNGRDVLLKHFYELSAGDMSYHEFLKQFFLFVLIRRLRSLGTYGFLGVSKQKRDFFEKITPGLKELCAILKEKEELAAFSHTKTMIESMLKSWLHRSKKPD
ncbi:MAG: phosphotransferase [Proteobacteria bacterium]|nr:phosphotransferase [Pseudomonadota bacterium]